MKDIKIIQERQKDEKEDHDALDAAMLKLESHKNGYESNWKGLWVHFNNLNDKSNSLALFKSMMKAYTSEACYREIGYFLRT